MDSSSKRNGFSVVTNGKGFMLYADTAEEKEQWKDAIALAIRGGGARLSTVRHHKETRTFYVVSI